MRQDREGERNETRTLGRTSVLSLLYLGVAFACLIQWRSPSVWSRVDIFSGGYLAIRVFGAIHSIFSSRKVFRSKSTRHEWWGLTSNPGGIKWVIVLMLGDLVVFVDYGHWHTMASLEQPTLQSLGLGLYACAAVWQWWTDACLAKYFSGPHAGREPIREGPFRYIRHPRYAGAAVGKVAFPVIFASLPGWLLALSWLLLLLRNIRAEEAHLRILFGAQYDVYARRTARLLPGIY